MGQRLPRLRSSDSVRILTLYGARDRLWLGGAFGLASIVNGKFSYAPIRGLERDDAVEAIAEDSTGTLWTVIWEGSRLRLSRLRDGEWKDYRDAPGLPVHRCRVAFPDSKGRVWFGFDSEAVVVENDLFHRYSASDGLPAGKILAIAEDRLGHIWVGGEGGMSRFDHNGGQCLP